MEPLVAPPLFTDVATHTANTAPVSPNSVFREVFGDEGQRKEFAKFIRTIFYRLDEGKVFAKMDELLKTNKSDQEIYEDLVRNIDSLNKRFSGIRRIWSLFVLKIGMGKQAKEFLKDYDKSRFNDYLEVYDRRYLNRLRADAKLPLKGKVISVCDKADFGMGERIQAGAWFSSYPYKKENFVPLNDANCQNPLLEVEKTHKPISADEVKDNSVDLIGCLGGLHHVPAERMPEFSQSLARVLRPGGVMLFRDHNVTTSKVAAIASMVHTFVNIADKQPWEVESKEVRNFVSMETWEKYLRRSGFTRVSPKCLVLKDDPTENGMAIFVKTPKTVDELKSAMQYRTDGLRSKQGTRATWIEWGNVRSAKEYASFLQNHHAFAFDYIGHLRQHWQHFYHYVKENLKDPEVSNLGFLFSGDMAMNLFILTTATLQLGSSAITSLPGLCMARWNDGKDWRTVNNLTAYERYEAHVEKEYSSFIDETPFYQFPYLSKIGGLWKAIWGSKEGIGTKLLTSLYAVSSSVSYIAKAAISWPIRKIYTSEAALEPDRVRVLVNDPHNLAEHYMEFQKQDKPNTRIEIMLASEDGHKMLSVPRYVPFTQFCQKMAANNIQVLEIGGQKQITVDVLQSKNSGKLDSEIYRTEGPQGSATVYATHQIGVDLLTNFLQTKHNVVYIHE